MPNRKKNRRMPMNQKKYEVVPSPQANGSRTIAGFNVSENGVGICFCPSEIRAKQIAKALNDLSDINQLRNAIQSAVAFIENTKMRTSEQEKQVILFRLKNALEESKC